MREPRSSKAKSQCRSCQQRPGQTPVGEVTHMSQLMRAWKLVAAFILTATLAVAQSPACPPNTADYPCVYVANGNGSTVSVINANTNRVIGTINAGKLPRPLALTPDNTLLYVVPTASFEVLVIDTATGSLTDTIQGLVGDTPPVQIAITPDGKFAYVVIPGSDVPAVNRIDTSTNQVVDQVIGVVSPTAIAFSPDSTRAYIADACSNFTGVCIDIVDTTASTPDVIKTLPVDSYFITGSIAVTADGSIVCFSIADPDLGNTAVACADPASDNPPNVIPLNQAIQALPTYGMAILPNNVLYLSEGGANSPNDVAFFTATLTSTPTPTQVQVGNMPIGLAIGPGGGSIYVSNAADDTVSVIDVESNSVNTISGTFFGPQGVAAMTAAPPVISTQPSSQTILSGTSATLSVSVTSSAPATLQWYQGQSGDASIPIEGAVGSSYTTPALTATTSYWVQATNIAGPVNSNTATITVTTNHPPSCTLSVAGAGSQTFTTPFSVVATANCSDPQGATLTASIDFGDGTTATGVVTNGAYSATHTYESVNSFPIQLTATDSFGLQSSPALYSWTIVPTTETTPVFSGQSSTVTVTLVSPSGQSEEVTFECTTVTTINGTTATFTPASDVGISCNSVPSQITLTSTPQTVTLEIHTTGPALAQAPPRVPHQIWPFAFWLLLPAVALAGIAVWPRRSRTRWANALAPAALALLALAISCGGGFTAPTVEAITPAGNYQVTVVDLPATTSSGFEQTSLIVPLTVSPFQ